MYQNTNPLRYKCTKLQMYQDTNALITNVPGYKCTKIHMH